MVAVIHDYQPHVIALAAELRADVVGGNLT